MKNPEPKPAHYVGIPDDFNHKVTYTCQDIVYLEYKGLRQTPNSLCLCLTVCHLTGSSQIVLRLNTQGQRAA